jgi:hypothetical protein
MPPAKRVSPLDGLLAQIKPDGSTPRLSNGRPDLTGIWGGNFPTAAGPYAYRNLETIESDQTVMERGNLWNKPIYKPELWAKVLDMDFSEVQVDPGFHCQWLGVPRYNAPNQIVQTANTIVAYYNRGAAVRIIPTDGRKRDNFDTDYETVLGMSLGHWEGDTLVIESVGFGDTTWLHWQGYFHSNKLIVTERLRREGDILYYSFVADDPEVLATPWTSPTYVRRVNPDPLARLEEYAPCSEEDLEKMVDKRFRG